MQDLFAEHKISFVSDFSEFVALAHGTYKALKFKKVYIDFCHPADTGPKLNVHKTFRGRPGRLLNALCILNLRPVSTGYL